MTCHAGSLSLGRVVLAFPSASCSHTRLRPNSRLAELNIDQIRTLDRQRTVILLPGGILEEHGPYLPSPQTAITTNV
jgi:hypothetical protein